MTRAPALAFEQCRLDREPGVELLVGQYGTAPAVIMVMRNGVERLGIVPIRREELDRVIEGLKRLREIDRGVASKDSGQREVLAAAGMGEAPSVKAARPRRRTA